MKDELLNLDEVQACEKMITEFKNVAENLIKPELSKDNESSPEDIVKAQEYANDLMMAEVTDVRPGGIVIYENTESGSQWQVRAHSKGYERTLTATGHCEQWNTLYTDGPHNEDTEVPVTVNLDLGINEKETPEKGNLPNSTTLEITVAYDHHKLYTNPSEHVFSTN